MARCRTDLARDGMYNLDDLRQVRRSSSAALVEAAPSSHSLSFTQSRRHNIYFSKEVLGLPADHPALGTAETINHTVCADQITQSIPLWIYESSPLIIFIAVTMHKDSLYPMRTIWRR